MEHISKLINLDTLKSHIDFNISQSKRTFKREVLANLGSEEEVAKALFICYQSEVARRGRSVVVTEELLSVFKRIARWLINPDTKPWLMFYGPVGNGKTTLLRAIQTLINSQRLKYGCYPINMKVYDSIRITDVAVENRGFFNEIKTYDALGIDDLGIEPLEVNQYGTITSPMVELLLKRYESMSLTMFTSNLGYTNLKERYKERIADRLKEVCDLMYIPMNSFR